jgi:3-oxoacyl-[acyl-carrier protein] reductase
MDMGLAGKWALVCAASKGLGRGCAQALVREGVNVVITARGADALDATAAALRASVQGSAYPNVQVISVVGDIATPAGRAAALAACPQVDILVNNAGGPPPGDFRDWDRDAWIAALDANMLTPIELMKATVDGMAERGFGRVVNITSGAVKAPIDTLGLSNGARAGLTGFVAGLARQPRLASHNVTINNLLPGLFDTDRIRSAMSAAASKAGKTLDEAVAARVTTVPARRLGNADEFGAMCVMLCSAQSAYLTGQNILLDGGAFGGTL